LDGVVVRLRRLKKSDIDAVIALHRQLDDREQYFRFFVAHPSYMRRSPKRWWKQALFSMRSEHSRDNALFAQALVRAQSRIAATAPFADVGLLAGGVVATVGELGWFEEMAARRGLSLRAIADKLGARYGTETSAPTLTMRHPLFWRRPRSWALP
jgi:hypothetical protein